MLYFVNILVFVLCVMEVSVVERGMFWNFTAQIVESVKLAEGLLIGEEIGSQAQPIPFDGAPQSGQGGGKHIHGGKFPMFFLRCRNGSVDKAVVQPSGISGGQIIVEKAAVHAVVVAHKDDRGVFVERLLCYPLYKFRNTAIGA